MGFTQTPAPAIGPVPPPNRRPASSQQRGWLNWFLTIVMVLAMPLLLLPDATVTAQTAVIEVSGFPVPLSRMSVVGRQFPAGDRLQIVWDGSKQQMPKVRASAEGTFEIGVSVPSSANPGSHVIAVVRASGPTSEVLARTFLVVLAPRAEQAADIASPADSLAAPTATAIPSPTADQIEADVPPSDGGQRPDPTPAAATSTPVAVAAAAAPTTQPTSPPAPASTPKPTAASGLQTVFVANGETGDASQWCYVHSAVGVGVVTSPVRAGGYAYRSEVRDGAEIFDTERSEFSNGPGACNKYLYTAGSETWTSFSIFPAADYPTYDHWSLVAQWHEPWGGTPPQQINLENDRWAIVGANSVSPRPRYTFGTLQRGRWQDFVVHQKWSTDPSVGFVEVFLNGQLVLPKTPMRTLENNNPVFLSVGQYRDTDPDSGTGVLFIDEVVVQLVR